MGTPAQVEEQIDGTVVFIGGEPEDVVVRVYRSKVAVSSFSIRWEGPHSPVVRPKTFASFNWKLIPSFQMSFLLRDLIPMVREIRRSQFKQCSVCKEVKAPEDLHFIDEKHVCHGCSEWHLGIVH